MFILTSKKSLIWRRLLTTCQVVVSDSVSVCQCTWVSFSWWVEVYTWSDGTITFKWASFWVVSSCVSCYWAIDYTNYSKLLLNCNSFVIFFEINIMHIQISLVLIVLYCTSILCDSDPENNPVKKKLQIGIKKRVDECKIKTKKGDFLYIHYRVSCRLHYLLYRYPNPQVYFIRQW